MRVIGGLLIGTVILAYAVAFLERYGQLLLVLAGWILLGVLALAGLVVAARGCWSWFCQWWELRQVRIQAAQAIRRANTHFENSRAEMEQLARAYHLRKGITQ
ncbi:hypothetical protein Lesp02_28350 [Lentzea sp. NBRC 105346]|uniref:hypothetical protein n=1 Tax=Lentzea sp. NBRC 105346 TaxID=3032205 RepID=UPI0025559101|nr:hypothetical protein [Lentzea sp. NBRC 105346]GLZ30646.1 hypothetical protein Lesp02_28350 [Lentzea sp. NBRC 105346]